MTRLKHFVVKPGGLDGVPRVERIARWQLIGHAEPELTADEFRDEFMLGLRDAGVGPEPVLAYKVDDGGERHPYLVWPELAADDPEHARLVALASTGVFDEVPELDSQPERDRALEAEIERLAHEDRLRMARSERTRARLSAFVAYPDRVERRVGRAARSQPPNASRPEILEGELTPSGWHWWRAGRGRLQLRGRLRR